MHKKCGKQINSDCAMKIAAKVIGDIWTLVIVKELLEGTKRFKDLEAAIDGISTKTLCNRLSLLEENHLVLRHSYNETPPRVEYELSDKGKKLDKIIKEIEEFGANVL